jgi:hypothetical protein
LIRTEADHAEATDASRLWPYFSAASFFSLWIASHSMWRENHRNSFSFSPPIIDECSSIITATVGAATHKVNSQLLLFIFLSSNSSYSVWIEFQLFIVLFQSVGLVPCFFFFLSLRAHATFDLVCVSSSDWLDGWNPFRYYIEPFVKKQLLVHSTVMISDDIIQLLQNILARVQAPFKKSRGWRHGLPP